MQPGSGRLFALSLSVSAGLTVVLLLVNLLAAMIDRAPLRERVVGAFASGELAGITHEMENRRGRHQYRDCLILVELLDVRETPLRRSLSPLSNYFDVSESDACVYLEDTVLNIKAGDAPPASNYHRYIHGNVATTAVLLSFFDLYQVRNRLSFVFALTLSGVLLWQAFKTARALGFVSRSTDGQDQAVRASELVRSVQLAFLCLLLMFCYALAVFSMSLAHFWTDYVLALYVVIVFTWPQAILSAKTSVIVHSVFGVLITYFEFLHGGIPLGACFIFIAAGALSVSRANPVLVGGIALASFLCGIVVIVAIKLSVTAAVFGPHIIENFTYPLGFRTFGKDVSTATHIRELSVFAGDVAGNWTWLGRIILLGSVVMVAWSVWRGFVSKASPANPWRIALLVGGYVAVPVWYSVFRQHTEEHPFFMTRTSVGMLASAGVLYGVVFSDVIARGLRNSAALLSPPATPNQAFPPERDQLKTANPGLGLPESPRGRSGVQGMHGAAASAALDPRAL